MAQASWSFKCTQKEPSMWNPLSNITDRTVSRAEIWNSIDGLAFLSYLDCLHSLTLVQQEQEAMKCILLDDIVYFQGSTMYHSFTALWHYSCDFVYQVQSFFVHIEMIGKTWDQATVIHCMYGEG